MLTVAAAHALFIRQDIEAIAIQYKCEKRRSIFHHELMADNTEEYESSNAIKIRDHITITMCST